MPRGRHERMKRGIGMKGRDERSRGIDIRIADVFTIIKPTAPFKAKHEIQSSCSIHCQRNENDWVRAIQVDVPIMPDFNSDTPKPNMGHGIVHDQGVRRRETVILSLRFLQDDIVRSCGRRIRRFIPYDSIYSTKGS